MTTRKPEQDTSREPTPDDFYHHAVLVKYGVLLPRWASGSHAVNAVAGLIAAEKGVSLAYYLKKHGEELRPVLEPQYNPHSKALDWEMVPDAAKFFYNNGILLKYAVMLPRWVPTQQALYLIVGMVSAEMGMGAAYCMLQYGEESRLCVDAQHMDKLAWEQWYKQLTGNEIVAGG